MGGERAGERVREGWRETSRLSRQTLPAREARHPQRRAILPRAYEVSRVEVEITRGSHRRQRGARP
jgi:hypothetical protein